MLKEIIDEIKDSFKIDISWADTFAGLAKSVVRNVSRPDGTVISKRFPVYENYNKTTCKANDYIDLVPDTNKQGIIYFTEQNTVQISCTSRFVNYESIVRCVAWVNLKKINKTYQNTDILLNDLMSKLPRSVISVGTCKINICHRAPVIKSPAIFAEYAYSEEQNQYLMYPYDYFAFEFSIQWSLPYNCVNPSLNPDPCK